MEQIKQLKAMRDAARARIAATADYKLMTSLDALITDLEKAFGAADDAPAPDRSADSDPEEPAPAERAEPEAARTGSGEGPATIFNGKARKAVNPEEDAIDQAVAELEAELVSAGASDKHN